METFINGLNGYLQTSMAMAFLAAFGGGVLASLTPCVYPMIPITVSYIGSSNIGGSRKRAFTLATVYVTGIAVTYAAMGIFAALTGRLFGEFNSSPWSFLLVGNIILFLGLSMLDVFTLPIFVPKDNGAKGGFLSTFGLGLSSGLVAGPCTAPVLGVLLAYVASTGNALLGGALLFVFAFGMGILLIAVGTFSGLMASMPKSGNWMVKIKKGLGWVMIILAEYFLVQAGKLFL
ncbi:MAG: cytochrome c biogenesis protein CcdA [Thermodesulfobacteriota bacterium]